jgi:hypothetical protein
LHLLVTVCFLFGGFKKEISILRIITINKSFVTFVAFGTSNFGLVEYSCKYSRLFSTNKKEGCKNFEPIFNAINSRFSKQ